MDLTLYLFIVSAINFSFHFYFTFMLEPLQWSRHHILCMSPRSVCSLWPLLPLPRPSVPAPLCSIGTREGVTQKNLSGLLPVRDFRLDPSLLYSLPLLAWAQTCSSSGCSQHSLPAGQKLRCSWAWDPLSMFLFSLSSLRLSQHFLSLFFLFFLLWVRSCVQTMQNSFVDSAFLSNSQSKGLGVSSALPISSLSLSLLSLLLSLSLLSLSHSLPLSLVIMDEKSLYNNLWHNKYSDYFRGFIKNRYSYIFKI